MTKGSQAIPPGCPDEGAAAPGSGKGSSLRSRRRRIPNLRSLRSLPGRVIPLASAALAPAAPALAGRRS